MLDKLKKHIDKLVVEYDTKIKDCDIQLDSIYHERRSIKDNNDYIILTRERSMWDARKIAYMQAKVDIESFYDILGCNKCKLGNK